MLRRLTHPSPDDPTAGPVQVVVAPVRSLLQPMVAGLADLEPLAVRAGETLDLDAMVERLVDIAYARVDLVTKRGEFAVRGGILDVFPPTDEHPLRVELWGDTVEEIRYFTVADQRSLEVAPLGLWAPPCRELLLTPEVRARAKALAAKQPQLRGDPRVRSPTASRSRGWRPRPGAGRPDGAAARHAPGRRPRGAVRPRADPHPRRRPGRHQRRVPRGVLGDRLGRRAGPDRPRRRGVPGPRGHPRGRRAAMGVPWWSLTPFAGEEQLEDDTTVVAARATRSYRGDTERGVTRRRGTGSGRARASCSSPRATARRSGWWRCWRESELGARLVEDLDRGAAGRRS